MVEELSNFARRQRPASSKSLGVGWSALPTQHGPTAKASGALESQQPYVILPDTLPGTSALFCSSEYKVKMPR